jgi:hypothetical protein
MSDVEVVREVYAAMAGRDVDRLFERIDSTFVVDTAAMLEALEPPS